MKTPSRRPANSVARSRTCLFGGGRSARTSTELWRRRQRWLSYGDSELAFLDWEIQAGVLDPVTGSAWWRNVKSALHLSVRAGRLPAQHGLAGDQAPYPTRCWLTFIADPTPRHWYRAHNASILAGFALHQEEARAENAVVSCFSTSPSIG